MANGKRWTMALAIVTLLGGGNACAQVDDPHSPPEVPPLGAVVASPRAFLLQLFGKPIGSIPESTGDLNGDGRDDWAGVVEWDDSAANHAQLFILLQQADGSFVLTERSVAAETGRASVEEVSIGDGALTVAYSYNGSATSRSVISCHYKFYKGAWKLVGSDEYSFDIDTQKDRWFSTNNLTGRTEAQALGKNGKRFTTEVGHTDEKAALLHDVSLFGR